MASGRADDENEDGGTAEKEYQQCDLLCCLGDLHFLKVSV